MRELTLQLVEKVEVGDPVLLLMVAKSRWYQTDEGAVYTSLRPEEACEIDAQQYALWLTRACEDTLGRMKHYTGSLSAEPTREGLVAAGIPEFMIDGLLVSRNHYGDIDMNAPYCDVELQPDFLMRNGSIRIIAKDTAQCIHKAGTGVNDDLGARIGTISIKSVDFAEQLPA